MELLDEMAGDAGKINAVNTVVNNKGRLSGYNTDGLGAVQALTEKAVIKDAEVAILGAGGAARAIGFGVVAEGGRVTIVNRSTAAGEKLADDLGGNFLPLSESHRIQCEVMVNATSVGMKPDIEAMPVPESILQKDMVVMDIVYNPLQTLLLKKAAEMGCITIDGVAMLVNQGAKQFELWTGREAPTEIMRMAVLAEL
jgi:shikimate dehydrogenase